MNVMTEYELRIAHNRLCSRATIGGKYHPECCQRCESACKYGTKLLHHYGMERPTKETPQEHISVGSSDRLRRCLKGINRRNISK